MSIHYFNSTIVRLKVSKPLRNAQRRGYFNSTIVRLKDGLCRCLYDGGINFNSTIVRLKAKYNISISVY